MCDSPDFRSNFNNSIGKLVIEIQIEMKSETFTYCWVQSRKTADVTIASQMLIG